MSYANGNNGSFAELYKQRRFSHALLLPREYHFGEFSASCFLRLKGIEEKRKCRGTLSICSSSLFFDPKEKMFPLFRIDISNIGSCSIVCQQEQQEQAAATSTVTSESDQLASSGSKGTNNSTAALVLQLTAQAVLLNDRPSLEQEQYEFYLSDSSPEYARWLVSKLIEARNASNEEEWHTLHTALITEHENRQSETAFDREAFTQITSNKIVCETKVLNVEPLYRFRGLLILSTSSIFFKCFADNVHHVPQEIALSNISRIVKKPFAGKNLAIEIYFVSCGSLFFAFESTKERDHFYEQLAAQSVLRLNKRYTLKEYTQRWENSQITNFEYLMFLNEEAGRTTKDLSQYPILPWVIKDYSSNLADLLAPATYRDLSKPIRALNETESTKKDSTAFYSEPIRVLRLLARAFPQLYANAVRNNNNNNNNIFIDVGQEWNSVTNDAGNITELTPEFYSGSGSFLLKTEDVAADTPVSLGDVVLPGWAKDPAHFIEYMSLALESTYVSTNIHYWIDYTFGCKQAETLPKGADLSVFENDSVLDCIYTSSVTLAQAKAPIQLFTEQHAQKYPKRTAAFEKAIARVHDELLTDLKEQVKRERRSASMSFNNLKELVNADRKAEIDNLKKEIERLEKELEKARQVSMQASSSEPAPSPEGGVAIVSAAGIEERTVSAEPEEHGKLLAAAKEEHTKALAESKEELTKAIKDEYAIALAAVQEEHAKTVMQLQQDLAQQKEESQKHQEAIVQLLKALENAQQTHNTMVETLKSEQQAIMQRSDEKDTTIEQLKQSNAKLVSDYEEQLNKLNTEKQEALEQLQEESKAAIERLRNELHLKEKAVEQLSKCKDEEIARVQQGNESIVNQLIAEKHLLEDNIAKLNKEKAEAVERLTNEMQIIIDRLEQDKVELQQSHEAAMQKLEASKNVEIQNLTEQLQQKQRDLEALDTQKFQETEQLTFKYEDELEQQKQLLETEKENNRKYKEEQEKVQTELRIEVENLKTISDELDKMLKEREAEVEALTLENSKLKLEEAAKEKTIEELNAKLSAEKKKASQVRNTQKNLARTLKTQISVEALKAATNKEILTETTLKQLEADYEKLQNKAATITEERNELKKQNAILTSKMASMTAKTELTVSELRREAQRHAQEAAELRAKNRELSQEIHDLNKKVRQAEINLHMMQQKIAAEQLKQAKFSALVAPEPSDLTAASPQSVKSARSTPSTKIHQVRPPTSARSSATKGSALTKPSPRPASSAATPNNNNNRNAALQSKRTHRTTSPAVATTPITPPSPQKQQQQHQQQDVHEPIDFSSPEKPEPTITPATATADSAAVMDPLMSVASPIEKPKSSLSQILLSSNSYDGNSDDSGVLHTALDDSVVLTNQHDHSANDDSIDAILMNNNNNSNNNSNHIGNLSNDGGHSSDDEDDDEIVNILPQ